MATAMYGKSRQAFAGGDLDWDADTFRAMLVDASVYTVSIDVDEFLDDIPAGAQIISSSALANKTNVLGTLAAADVVYTALAQQTDEIIGTVVLYQDTGLASTSRLVAYIDNAAALPVPPNGSDVFIFWDNGADKVLTI